MSSIQIGLDAALILAGAIYGYILSLNLVVGKEGNQTARNLAATFVLVYSIHITEYVALMSGLIFHLPYLVGVTFPLLLLVGPVFLLYVEALNRPNFHYKRQHLLYVTPFLVWLVYFVPFYFESLSSKMDFINELASLQISPAPFLYGLSTLMTNLLFAYLAYRKIFQYEVWLSHNHSTDRLFRLKWTKKLALGFTLLIVLNTISFIANKINNTYVLELDVLFVLGMVVIIIMIGHNAQIRSNTYSIYLPITSANINEPKYQTSSLDQSKVEQIKGLLLSHISEHKPYLNSELKVSDLADQINVPAYHLSQIVNQEFGTNFFEFINQYRIESAKRMLRDESFDHFKILAVAIENGFNNKASFNRVFKKYTAVTPSEYRRKGKDRLETKQISA